ncbi:hypothetical protein GOP47_0003596 [Adiantum capillus-veneris]|uniref:RNA helicase n=1 Tax=Adiantum capillus-veneris TaxID=13818 RepID=A0A9D4V687_ADICA|nr:hypothetical protein GOP47_0003596 [Adiantum capillus-veneris]
MPSFPNNNSPHCTMSHHSSSRKRPARQDIQEQRRALPIASAEKKLVEEVLKNDTLVVIGETGSGKTTQLPQFLHAGGFCERGRIGITQPRRVAAVTVAARVAEEMGVDLGQEVGYSIRFEDKTSAATEIKYLTDGMLLREALLDPLLHNYSVIIVDEAHERTIHTDVLLGLLKAVQKRRKAVKQETVTETRQFDSSKRTAISKHSESFNQARISHLKLVVMSATLDAEGFSQYFDNGRTVYIQGRQYPVDILYTYQPEPDYLDAVLITIFQVHLEEKAGDVLVFLTGQEEIEAVERLLLERSVHLPVGSLKLMVAPIYAALPCDQQMQVFKTTPRGSRKVILATNIAETSVTIPGVCYVIDPGLVKARIFNPQAGVESLSVLPVSKAQALQRSGRAGRERPGKCFRLYTEDTFYKLEDASIPEIKRCNLASVVLQLKALGIDDILGFDFMDKPSSTAIRKSLEHLYILGALTDEGKLSDPLGFQMSRLPVEPLYAKAVIISCEYKCSAEMLGLVAMLSVESIFYQPRGKLEEAKAAKQRFLCADGDHITLVNVLRAYVSEVEKTGNGRVPGKGNLRWCKENFINGRSLRRALDIYRQIERYLPGMGLSTVSCVEEWMQFRRCLTAAFFLNTARRQPDGSYRAMSSGQTVFVHPSSVLFGKKPDCLIFNELVCTTRHYIRNVTRIDSAWLPELASQYFVTKLAA